MIAERASTNSKLYLDENDDKYINEPLNSNEEKNEESKGDVENSDDIIEENSETNEVN